ncbi:MAG: hypothetical protein K6T83_04695 [Alicyclobacillus sp.]|nr:hypothetical protein [Alicyclobacillus sp.]
MTDLYDDTTFAAPSADYEDLAEALSLIAPHRTPPAGATREFVVSCKIEYLDSIPFTELSAEEREAAIDQLITAMYSRYRPFPVDHQVTPSGVVLRWRVPGQRDLAFPGDLQTASGCHSEDAGEKGVVPDADRG